MPKEKLVVKRNINNYSSTEEVVNDILKERFSMDEYLANMSSLEDPFKFKDMQIAVEKITEYLKAGKSICVYGDYDVDGTTSVYLTYNLLNRLVKILGSTSKIGYYIPHREKEGYGVNNSALDKIRLENGFDLVISVDCGISNYLQVEHAKEIGLDFIVTDHHEYPQNVPDCPIINPHDGHYPFSKLSGCGTVFKLMEALYIYNNQPRGLVFDYLDIAAISTVADLMDLVGENRIIVKYGLYLLQNYVDKGTRPWLNKLLEKAKFNSMIDSFTIGFVIGPRINSVGRLNHSMRSLEFMLSDDEAVLEKYGTIIEQMNDERKKLQDDIVKVGDNIIEESGVANSINIVVDGRVGVVGLAASNLLEKHYRPTTVFSSSVNPDVYKASARSIDGFNYFEEVIEKNRDIIVGGGGHAAAAGLAVKKENIEEFNNRVNKAVEECLKKDPDLLTRKIYVDCELEPESIDVPLVKKVEQMAPFGMGNPTPTFFLRNMSIKELKGVPVKDPKHLQITLVRDETVFKGMIFKRYDLLEELQTMGTIDVAFSLSLNTFLGKTEVNLLINYFRPSIESELDRNIDIE